MPAIIPKSSDALRLSARKLLAWYGRHRRDLPWRRTRDPYRIWISEVMLQQTQVATVVPYYRRFLKRFPDLEALAEAREDEVLAAWSGLGYYRRARHLHAAARTLSREHGGRFPQDVRLLRRLPGIGRYTAGALASIAFDQKEAAIDGNAERVLRRLLALKEPGVGSSRILEETARGMMLAASPSGINQALMELGALLCAPASPLCGRCPLGRACHARKRGLQEEIPVPKKRRSLEKHRAAVAVVRKGEAFLMLRRDGGELLRGMWEFPGDFLERGEDAQSGLDRIGRERLGRGIVPGKMLTRLGQTLTYRKVDVWAYEAVLAEPAPAGWRLPSGARWLPRGEARRLPHGSRTAKLLRLLEAPGRKKEARGDGGKRP